MANTSKEGEMAVILPFPHARRPQPFPYQEPTLFIPAALAASMKAHLSWLPELAAILQEEGLEVSEQELLLLALSSGLFVPTDQEGEPQAGPQGGPHDAE
jgi:hypothetical protein